MALNGLALGDLDGDKVPDLLAFTDNQVLCLHGDKTGAFAPWSTNLTADLVAQDLGPTRRSWTSTAMASSTFSRPTSTRRACFFCSEGQRTIGPSGPTP